MDTVVVTRRVATTSVALRHDGALRWDTRAFDVLPKILGNADPVHYAQMLPGVQTNSELDAGLHIQGSDNTHNMLSVQGVPIYNASHLLGLFSVFNAPHYSSMTLKKMANEGGDPSRIGGTLTMELPTAPHDSLNGELSVGLISSQGTMRIPIGKKAGLTISGRGSYLNLLYSRWLTVEDLGMRYAFGDANMTWTLQPNEKNKLWIDAYWGCDKVNVEQDEYSAQINLRWGNCMTAMHWNYDRNDNLKTRSTIYYTRYSNRLRLSQGEMLFHLPSDIGDMGWHGELEYKDWRVGAETIWHNILPQSPEADNIYNQTLKPQPHYHTQEYTLFADYTHTLITHLLATLGIRTSAYMDYKAKCHLGADPSLRLSYTRNNWQITADYSIRHQYLYQTGTTSLGMPTEFWMSIGEECQPQWGHNVSLSSAIYMWNGRLRLSAECYYKRLYNQVEYDGDMMKFLNADYRLADNLLHGRGYNYGFNLMLSKRTGKLTGWINYAYGRARRQFAEDGYKHTFSATHERPHEINILLSYRIGKHCTMAATYVFASGTPFTAPQNFYIMNGMLLTQYGPHNDRRLRPYRRLDLSANYLFTSRHLRESGLNLSLYNATMRHNDITCRLKVHDGHYLYSHFALIKFILPSVSYFLKF